MSLPTLTLLLAAGMLIASLPFHVEPPSQSPREPRKTRWIGCVLAASLAAALALVGIFLGARTWIGFGESSHATRTDVSQQRVRRCLPPGAGEITLYQELGGHFARYEVSEADFYGFLDALWEAEEGQSAHERAQMSGEGEPAKPKQFARRFELLGWKPLENAVTYYGPSKSSGAMTTYYYDPVAGVAYHDTGYW